MKFDEWMQHNGYDIYDVKDMIKILKNGEYTNEDFFEIFKKEV